MMHLDHFISSNREKLEVALFERLPISHFPCTERFNQSLQYAVFPGGKRLRPMFTLLASSLAGASDKQSMELACAMEFIHTSSLVLDDLPGMDDATIRRDRPALHLVFGEGLSVLVAVALLNKAYALFSDAAECASNAKTLNRLISEAVRTIGCDGMIAGQAADLQMSGVCGDNGTLSTRELKTTALMRLMMSSGGIIAGAPESDVFALANFGEYVGSAYQIYDDLMDTLSEGDITGKSTNQDSRHRRPTLIRELTTQECITLASTMIDRAKHVLLERFGERTQVALLLEAADRIPSQFNEAKLFS